jgi:hypothetical protein
MVTNKETTTMRNLAKTAFILTTLFFNAFAAASTEEAQQRRWLITLKPSALFLGTGAGLELGREVSRSGDLVAHAELDHFLVGGAAFLGVSWRQYLGSGFYMQNGAGYGEQFFHSWVQRTPALMSSVGYEWRAQKTIQWGVDIIGAQIPVTQDGIESPWPTFPKVRFSLRL